VLKARVDSGEAAWALVSRVVSPAGTTARCDYHIVYGYSDMLPEPFTPASTDAALKRAGLGMTAEAWAARRDSISRLVAAQVLRGVDSVDMPGIAKGAYIRLNHYKIRPGQTNAAWLDIERNVWKKLVEADNAAGNKSGWSSNIITMPSGSTVFANAMTADIYPDWKALMRGIPINDLWPKVLGNRSRAQWSDQLATIADRPLVEITTVVELVPPKSSTSSGGNN
jgi:hypothetical protein